MDHVLKWVTHKSSEALLSCPWRFSILFFFSGASSLWEAAGFSVFFLWRDVHSYQGGGFVHIFYVHPLNLGEIHFKEQIFSKWVGEKTWKDDKQSSLGCLSLGIVMPTWMETQLLRQPGWQSFGIDSLYRLFELQKNIGFMQREHASLYYRDYYNLLCAVLFFGRGTHAFWLFRGLKQFVLVRLLRPHTTWAAKRVAEGGKSRLVKYCTLTRFVWVTEILQEEPDWIKICDGGTGLNRLFWTF